MTLRHAVGYNQTTIHNFVIISSNVFSLMLLRGHHSSLWSGGDPLELDAV